MPALLARYRDLTQLRYDFPLVLVRGAGADRSCVQSLSAIVDGVAHAIAHEDDTDRVTNHLLRIEQRIRSLVTGGANGWLSALWDRAAQQLAVHGDDALKDSLARGRAALKVDGEVVDCGRALPTNVLRHSWNAVQEQKARRFRAEIGGLILKLSDILRADFVQSKAGRSAESLKASVGFAHGEVFDFDAMARVLGKPAPRSALPAARRRRIEDLLKVMKSQCFYSGIEGALAGTQIYSFVFDNCGSALAARSEEHTSELQSH